MIEFKVRYFIWLFLLLLVLWGISDLLVRYVQSKEVSYLASSFFSSFIFVLIGFIKPER